MADPRLDRLPSFDPASRRYRIRSVLQDVALPRVSRQWTPGPTLDQGQEGACVGFACAHRLGSDPTIHNVNNEIARNIYHIAQDNDEWPGREPDYSGTSVLAGMKALHQLGRISEYRWIGAGSGTPIEDVALTLGHVGPVVFGLEWTPSMMNPRPSGLLEVDLSGADGSGHAICGVGIELQWAGEGTPVEVVKLQNSWGTSWGVEGGFCYITLTDLQTLLERSGEGAVPLEVVPFPVAS